MKTTRVLIWLVSLVALMMPPVATGHAMAPPQHVASVDCPDHAPPPDPCPSEGTAKHAASACCPLMSGTVAVLIAPAAIETPVFIDAPLSTSARSLVGCVFTKDPPPPRV